MGRFRNNHVFTGFSFSKEYRASGVYAVKNKITGRMYVGSTKRIYNRTLNHYSRLRAGKHYSPLMQQDCNTHGIGSFEYCILELCDASHLIEREAHYIMIHNTIMPNGYNSAASSARIGVPYNDETKRKISVSSKVLSAETRAKISKSQKERLKNKVIGDAVRVALYSHEGVLIAKFKSQKEASEKTGASYGAISQGVRGITKSLIGVWKKW